MNTKTIPAPGEATALPDTSAALLAALEQVEMDLGVLKDCVPNKQDRERFVAPVLERVRAAIAAAQGGFPMTGTDRDNRERNNAEARKRHDERIRRQEKGDSLFDFAVDLGRAHAAVLMAPSAALRPSSPDEPEALAAMPFVPPSSEDIDRMAAADEERLTEGPRHRAFPASPHVSVACHAHQN